MKRFPLTTGGEGRPRPMLWRKLGTDTRALARHATALLALTALGLALFVGLYEAYQNLTVVYGQIYRSTRFAAASAQFRPAPASLVYVARTIPHVRVAVGRLSADGAIVMREAKRERVRGRFVGVPRGRRPEVNDLLLTAGRYLTNGQEAVVEQQFARQNGLQVGDRLKCYYREAERDFTVVGLATSPEYVYPVPSKYVAFVAPGTFGVVFVEEERAREWFGTGAQITEIHCLTDPGYETEVRDKLAGLTGSYGLEFAYVQEEQPSKRLLTMDQQGLAQLSLLFPVIFLGVSALSLYSGLTRVTRMQMGVIGTLRACGFTRREVLGQYVAQGVLLAAVGALPGLALGHLMAVLLNRVYAASLYLPMASAAPHWGTMGAGLGMAMGAAAAAAYLPARQAAGLAPAQALRGEAEGRQWLRLEQRVVGWTQRLPVAYRIPVRGIFRRASRTVLAVAGIAAGACVIITTLGMQVSTMDAIEEMLTASRHYQIDLQFLGPGQSGTVAAATSLPGGRRVGLTVSLPVRISSSGGEGEVMLTGLQRGQELVRLKTVGAGTMQVRPGTIWLPRQLAERLRVERGDPVRVEWVQSSRRQRLRTVLRVAGSLDVAMGSMAYGEYEEVRRSLADRAWPQSAYGANFDCEPGQVEAFRHRFESAPEVLMVATTGDVKQQIDEALGTAFAFIAVLLTFGGALAGSVIQTVSSLTLLERTRELASLRTLGFSVRAATALLSAELLVLAAGGLAVGLPGGAWLNRWLLSGYQTETMSFRALLPGWVYLVTVLIVIGLVGWASYLAARRLRGLDLAQAAKAVE